MRFAMLPVSHAALAQDADRLLAEFRELWCARSRPGGLVETIARLAQVRRTY